jgi:hypothetical protein
MAEIIRETPMRALSGAVLSLLLLHAIASVTEEDGLAVEQIGTMARAPLAEISGIARSDRYPGVYWVHNDSDDEARVFAIDSEGKVLFPAYLEQRYHGETEVAKRDPWPGIHIPNASNIDWEDVALANGQLFIADVGNNANTRRDLGVYVLNEPNPLATQAARALRFLPIRYPEQESFPPTGTWRYDCEAIFVHEGKIHLLTRHRKAGELLGITRGTRLYRLDSSFTDRENVLTFLDSRDDLIAVGAADLSPDGRKLAVLTYATLWVFDRPSSGGRWLSGAARRLELSIGRMKQVEALCWDDAETLRVANEQREIFRVPLAMLEPAGP